MRRRGSAAVMASCAVLEANPVEQGIVIRTGVGWTAAGGAPAGQRLTAPAVERRTYTWPEGDATGGVRTPC
ncbi:hypothetical protein ACIQZO_08045 [Streptomyces sp. NPDC097617]|uniref:hypothetical protein n=1 Tax=Streptomyces sp. NPDC097617 TaxID=3366091 RepID=UPI003827AFA6